MSKIDWVKNTGPNRMRFSKICNVFDGFEGISMWVLVICGENLKTLTLLLQDQCVCKEI